MTSQYQYEYDPTGRKPENVVSDKAHPLTPVQGSGYTLIVPKVGPFFREGFRLVHATSGKILKPDVDYVFTHFVMDLSHSLQKHIYGSVTVVNRHYMGDVIPTYQTIGGEHVLDEVSFANYAIHLLEADGAYPWDKLKGLPKEFPPEPHELPIETTAGYDELIEAIQKISFGADHMHDISNIRHLDDRLANMLDNSGNHKVLTAANVNIRNGFVGSVQCRLPKVKTDSVVRAKLQIIEKGNVYTLEVSGQIKPYNDGVVPASWNNGDIKSAYDTWPGDVYLSYDAEHYPTIYLGKEKEWLGGHVSVVEYFTTNPDKIEGELAPFRVSIARTISGMQYIDTNRAGYVLVPTNSRVGLTDVVNRRYFGVMPEGIYHGYQIIMSGANQITIGGANQRNSAVIYDGPDAATVVLDKQAQILNIPQAMRKTIVLELVPPSEGGDDRFLIDIPNREAQIRLVDAADVADNMLVIGVVNWPAEDPTFQLSHLSYEGRNNASWNAGTITPIRSDVTFDG